MLSTKARSPADIIEVKALLVGSSTIGQSGESGHIGGGLAIISGFLLNDGDSALTIKAVRGSSSVRILLRAPGVVINSILPSFT